MALTSDVYYWVSRMLIVAWGFQGETEVGRFFQAYAHSRWHSGFPPNPFSFLFRKFLMVMTGSKKMKKDNLNTLSRRYMPIASYNDTANFYHKGGNIKRLFRRSRHAMVYRSVFSHRSTSTLYVDLMSPYLLPRYSPLLARFPFPYYPERKQKNTCIQRRENPEVGIIFIYRDIVI